MKTESVKNIDFKAVKSAPPRENYQLLISQNNVTRKIQKEQSRYSPNGAKRINVLA